METRIQRVISRDQTSKEAILNRIKNQWTDEMRMAKSDYIIENIDLEIAKQQADKIFRKLSNPQN